MTASTCGDFGGKNRDGTPCGRPSNDGRCWNHTEAAEDAVQKAKAAFLEAYAEDALQTVAALAAGVSYVTIWRWRQADPEFDAQVRELEPAVADMRYALMEDSAFRQVVDGKAPAALTIFMLVNESMRRRDGRWRHIRQIQHSGRVGIYGAIAQLPPAEVERILGLPEEEQLDEIQKLLANPDSALRLGPGDGDDDE